RFLGPFMPGPTRKTADRYMKSAEKIDSHALGIHEPKTPPDSLSLRWDAEGDAGREASPLQESRVNLTMRSMLTMKRAGCAAFLGVMILCCAQLPGAPHIKVEQLAKTSLSWDGTSLPAYPEGKPEVTI